MDERWKKYLGMAPDELTDLTWNAYKPGTRVPENGREIIHVRFLRYDETNFHSSYNCNNKIVITTGQPGRNTGQYEFRNVTFLTDDDRDDILFASDVYKKKIGETDYLSNRFTAELQELEVAGQ